jgi:hypothetical protein
VVSHWYNRVSADLSQIVGAIDYYEGELEDAKKEVVLRGSLEKSAASLPGITENRFNQLQEIEAILEHLNIELRKKRSQVFKRFLEHYNRQLSSRDAEKYVDGDTDVVDLTVLVNQFALLRNKYLGVLKGLESKSFQLNNITRLRAAGLEDVHI